MNPTTGFAGPPPFNKGGLLRIHRTNSTIRLYNEENYPETG